MNIFSERVLFITMRSVTRTISGDRKQRHPHDWAFRSGILEAIARYKPKRVYIIDNEDDLTFGEEEITRRYDVVKKAVLSFTKYADYMFCLSLDENNPLRLPNTGMIEFFSREHFDNGFDVREILFVGEDEECATRLGCRFMKPHDFIQRYVNG